MPTTTSQDNKLTPEEFLHHLSIVDESFYYVILIKMLNHYGHATHEMLCENYSTAFWATTLKQTFEKFSYRWLWDKYCMLDWAEADKVDCKIAYKCLEILDELTKLALTALTVEVE